MEHLQSMNGPGRRSDSSLASEDEISHKISNLGSIKELGAVSFLSCLTSFVVQLLSSFFQHLRCTVAARRKTNF